MKTILLFAAMSLSCIHHSVAQIICILCYEQNDSISVGVNNLIANGSFESSNCTPNSNSYSFCPNSTNYTCNIAGWVCTGGGFNTYASEWTNALTTVADGYVAPYFGNDFCDACGNGDTTCLLNLDCAVTGIPAGYPINAPNYGGPNGLSLKQNVNGLIPGDTYILEFWTGGESGGNYFSNDGMFAVDVGFGDTMLRCKPTAPGQIGRRFIIEFIAASSSQTIKFTNWGHICPNCTELILDDVRLYTLAELSPSVTTCSGATNSTAFAASDTAVCQKFCISFTDQSLNAPLSWNWQFPGGDPSSSTSQNPPNICYNNPGTYDVTLITTTANGSDTLTLTDYITVYATPPVPTITQNGYTLTSSPASGYQWQLNNADIPGATNQTYDVTQSGYYTVFITDENGCLGASDNVYVLIDGMQEVIAAAHVLIYPNPSNGKFNLELSGSDFKDELEISIYSPLGQIVFSAAEIVGHDHLSKTIDLSELSPGVYFLEIQSGLKSVKKKLIISK